MFLTFLLLFVPVSLLLAYLVHAPALWIFITAALAVIPLADFMRRATEQLAILTGPAIGGLLNITFGNMPELILALFVLAAGHPEVVKGQLTGAIIGNGLLGLGLAILAGTWRREKQTFLREGAGLLSSLLILTMIALLVPALFHHTERGLYGRHNVEDLDERLSLAVSVVLIGVYLANLVYILVTHRSIFSRPTEARLAEWSFTRALGTLVLATAAIAVESELVADALELTAARLGLTSFFLGVIVLAILGNAAEYFTAIHFARTDRLGLAMGVTVGSTIQVALLVAPVLVLVSYLLGHPMDLVFANPLELIAIAAVPFAVNAIAHDGEATWFEGLMLVSVYVILGLAFFFMS